MECEHRGAVVGFGIRRFSMVQTGPARTGKFSIHPYTELSPMLNGRERVLPSEAGSKFLQSCGQCGLCSISVSLIRLLTQSELCMSTVSPSGRPHRLVQRFSIRAISKRKQRSRQLFIRVQTSSPLRSKGKGKHLIWMIRVAGDAATCREIVLYPASGGTRMCLHARHSIWFIWGADTLSPPCPAPAHAKF